MSIWQRVTERAEQLKGDSALYDLHPELRDRVHLLSVTSDEMPGDMSGTGYRQAAQDYTAHTWVNRAVTVLRNNIAHLPVRVISREGEAQPTHPLSQVLAVVNDSMAAPDLWGQWVTDMLLGGESGLELVLGSRGSVMEVWPRQPTQFTVITDPARRRYYGVSAYRIRFDATDEGFTLPRDEFVHFKFYNPINPWRGLAPIGAVRMGIVIDQLAQAWSRLFFRNSARPDYALIAPQGLARSEKEDLEELLMAKFGGVGSAHRPIILEDGITDIKPFSFPPKDITWLEQRKVARDEIAAVFGVPDEIMGFGRDTYENFDVAREVLWTLTIKPLLGLRDAALTEHFQRTGALRPGEQLATDYSAVPELQEDLTEKLEQAQRLFAMGVPFNEINERLSLGIADTPGGGTPFAGGWVAGPSSPRSGEMSPGDESEGNTPNSEIFGYHIDLGVVTRNEARAALGLEEMDTSEGDRLTSVAQQLAVLQAALNARVAPDDARRLSGLEDVEIIDPPANQGPFGLAPDRSIRTLQQQVHKDAVPALGSLDHEQRMKQAEERQEPHVEAMQAELKRQFQRQQIEIGRALRSQRSIGRGKLTDLPADDLRAQVKLSVEEVFDLIAETARFEEVFRAVVEEMIGDAGAAEMLRLNPDEDFDLARPEVQAAIDEVLGEMAEKVNDTTYTDLVDLFQEAERAGESLPEIQERLSAYFEGRKSDASTERIARTTTVGADSRGAVESYGQSGVVDEVAWLAALDARTRPAHVDAHGQRRKLGEQFDVGGERLRHPGDPRGSAGNIINCRCSVMPIVRE